MEFEPTTEQPQRTRANRPRKRAANACRRCRVQKIKCNGANPCAQCVKRNAACLFDDRRTVSHSVVRDLERRLAAFENERSNRASNGHQPAFNQHESNDGSICEDDDTWADHVDQQAPTRNGRRQPDPETSGSRSTSPTPRLMNPLGLDYSTFALDTQGRPIYLGTSSTWSFGKRVLALAHERVLHAPLPSERLHWEGEVYDLDFEKDLASSPLPSLIDVATMPHADFAVYLINTVKFYCGQMFHLLDEESFVRQFAVLHGDDATQKSTLSTLWQSHYLLILAFGKAFVARTSTGRHPPGWDLFLKGMQLMPNITFVVQDPMETIEVLCCAALYLHSLDFRCSAFRIIGQAVRLALAHGMHTNMHSQHISGAMLQRCRKIWWTVFVLDRQMTSLMGVALAMRDQDVTAELPLFPGSPQKAAALDLHVKLSKVITQIVYSVYGAEGRLNESFVVSTKVALKSIADVTHQIKAAFVLNVNEPSSGISRLAAYLHLLNHQCVVLATRPILFSFLDARLAEHEDRKARLPRSGSIRWLAQMCVESAQQMLRILGSLHEQSLLESFLPFDLDSIFMSAIVLIMAEAIDTNLVQSHVQWTREAYSLLDEIRSRGNVRAGYQKAELQQLEDILSSIPPNDLNMDQPNLTGARSQQAPALPDHPNLSPMLPEQESDVVGLDPLNMDMDSLLWQDGISTEHLMMVADALDLDGINWLPSIMSSSEPS